VGDDDSDCEESIISRKDSFSELQSTMTDSSRRPRKERKKPTVYVAEFNFEFSKISDSFSDYSFKLRW